MCATRVKKALVQTENKLVPSEQKLNWVCQVTQNENSKGLEKTQAAEFADLNDLYFSTAGFAFVWKHIWSLPPIFLGSMKPQQLILEKRPRTLQNICLALKLVPKQLGKRDWQYVAIVPFLLKKSETK